MVRITGCALLAAVLFCAKGYAQQSSEIHSSRSEIADNECLAKGGIGIVNQNLYIVVRSAKNELRLSQGNSWTGKDVRKPEVVIFFANKIWSPQELPEGFDISHAIIISFEAGKVRFFDFGNGSGGFYRRQEPRKE